MKYKPSVRLPNSVAELGASLFLGWNLNTRFLKLGMTGSGTVHLFTTARSFVTRKSTKSISGREPSAVFLLRLAPQQPLTSHKDFYISDAKESGDTGLPTKWN